MNKGVIGLKGKNTGNKKEVLRCTVGWEKFSGLI